MVAFVFKWSALILVLHLVAAFQPAQDIEAVFGNSRHPFFVSVTEINHNAAAGTIEISCKMFTDDFENALKYQYKLKLDLTQPQDRQQLEKLMNDYLQKHLQLKVNGKIAALSFLGFETESESAWCYLEVKQAPQVKTLEITNDLLYDAHSTQINIIHAVVAGNRKSTKMVNPEKHVVFQF